MNLPELNIGEILTNIAGNPYKIINRINKNRYVVEFIKTGNCVLASALAVYKKQVSDYSAERVNGVGYAFGTAENPVNPYTHSFCKWRSMLSRCYDPKPKGNYKNCKVCDEWLNFNSFQDWYKEQIEPIINKYPTIKWVIDKDLLSDSENNKEYSPSKCCFIPNAINTAIRNVYWEDGKLKGINERKAATLKRLLELYLPVLNPRIAGIIENAISSVAIESKEKPKTERKPRQRKPRIPKPSKPKIEFQAEIIIRDKVYKTTDLRRLKAIVNNLEKQNNIQQ